MVNDGDSRPASKEARVAAAIWGVTYAYQHLGMNDWYETLPDRRKRIARRLAKEIVDAPWLDGSTDDAG